MKRQTRNEAVHLIQSKEAVKSQKENERRISRAAEDKSKTTKEGNVQTQELKEANLTHSMFCKVLSILH